MVWDDGERKWATGGARHMRALTVKEELVPLNPDATPIRIDERDAHQVLTEHRIS